MSSVFWTVAPSQGGALGTEHVLVHTAYVFAVIGGMSIFPLPSLCGNCRRLGSCDSVVAVLRSYGRSKPMSHLLCFNGPSHRLEVGPHDLVYLRCHIIKPEVICQVDRIDLLLDKSLTRFDDKALNAQSKSPCMRGLTFGSCLDHRQRTNGQGSKAL